MTNFVNLCRAQREHHVAAIAALDTLIGDDTMPAPTFSVEAAKAHVAEPAVVAGRPHFPMHAEQFFPKVKPVEQPKPKAARKGIRAELSAIAVAAIRADTRTAEVVAAEHGISRSTVSNIKLHKGCYA